MNITDAGFRMPRIGLAEDEVQLWRVDLEAIRDQELRWQQLLSPDETIRAGRFHFAADRQRFVASRAWLRTILAAFLVAEPSELNFSYSKNEKPFLGPGHAKSGITFNVSHSGGIGLYAFTRRRDIGVDVEQIRRDFDVESIAHRFFSASEQVQLATFPESEKVDAFFRGWTRKEAYIKAIGEGLSLPLSQFDVSLQALETDALLATRPDNAEAEQWMIREVSGGVGYSAALCVRGQGWRLTHWR